MGKVLGIHHIVLRPDVNPAEFEQFCASEIGELLLYDGWNASLLKADRGEGAGQYALLIEIDSVQARDRFTPSDDVGSEEAEQFDSQLSAEERARSEAFWEKWTTFTESMPGSNTRHTDYIVVS
jgi:hypothetical protein